MLRSVSGGRGVSKAVDIALRNGIMTPKKGVILES